MFLLFFVHFVKGLWKSHLFLQEPMMHLKWHDSQSQMIVAKCFQTRSTWRCLIVIFCHNWFDEDMGMDTAWRDYKISNMEPLGGKSRSSHWNKMLKWPHLKSLKKKNSVLIRHDYHMMTQPSQSHWMFVLYGRLALVMLFMLYLIVLLHLLCLCTSVSRTVCINTLHNTATPNLVTRDELKIQQVEPTCIYTTDLSLIVFGNSEGFDDQIDLSLQAGHPSNSAHAQVQGNSMSMDELKLPDDFPAWLK